MTANIILKSGVTIPVKCESFEVTRNGLDIPTGYTITGISENNPIYLSWNDVSAVVRAMSDERQVTADD